MITKAPVSPIAEDVSEHRSRKARENPKYAAAVEQFRLAEQLARLIISYRVEHDLTQKQVAQMLNFTPSGKTIERVLRAFSKHVAFVDDDVAQDEYAPNVWVNPTVVHAVSSKKDCNARRSSTAFRFPAEVYELWPPPYISVARRRPCAQRGAARVATAIPLNANTRRPARPCPPPSGARR